MPAEGFDRALGASYQLIELVGRGAAGEVWRGVDRRTDEPVAAKLLRAEYVEDHELVGRFIRERSILVGLKHPNIVEVRDLVAEGDRLAIVMEYVAGGSLRTALSAGPLPAGLALEVTAAVLDALTLAHERTVLHRDVKPDNILLATDWRESAPSGVKLTDFGVASLVADRTTSSTGLVGTPEYMAPEQLLTGVAEFPVDIYATGILLYELLAGRTPFAGPGTGYVVAHRHVTMLPPRLPVPDPLWDLLARLLAKSPASRPTAPEAAALLRALPAGVVELAALEAQETPGSFTPSGGPVTEIRGLSPEPPDSATTPPVASVKPAAVAVPDLGPSGGGTVLRAMPVVPVTAVAETAPVRVTLRDRLRRLPWRSPRTIAVMVAAAVLIGLGVFWLAGHGRTPSADPSPPPPPAPVQQQSPARPTGLGIARSAVWDGSSGKVRLTITYSAQRSPLRGPYLEVLPGIGGSAVCPTVEWQDATVRRNLSSVTGIETPCGWSVQPEPVPARGDVTVNATIGLGPGGGDPTATLQEWLQTASAATDAATSDGEVTSTAYPAQRLTDVQVVAPARAVSGTTLRISLLPVWPSGADQLNPMFVSPPSGRPAETLIATAGGTSGVRFADGCSGALSISSDKLVVTAESVDDACQVDATVGNFTDLTSNSFAITTRGS